MTYNDHKSVSSATLLRVFGTDLSAESDRSNQAHEATVPVPPTTGEPSPQRCHYSLASLRTLRHNRRIALPENITHNRDGQRRKIPTLKPNPPTPFSSLSLPKELSDALKSLSLTVATPIQATAIPYARLGGDLVAQATSGTGKTLTYALAVLDSILPATPTKTALIIVPARELAAQVAEVFTKLSRVRVVTLVGGTKESVDEDNLLKPANVVVGTPGRVEVMVTRGSFDVSSVKVLVLDEADRLLDGSFGGSVERICNMLPTRQTLAFSATFSYSFRMSLLEVMREPAWIGGSQVVHSVIQYKESRHDLTGKTNTLRTLLQRAKFSLCLVFFNAKKAAGRVVRNLTNAFSFQTRLIHAGMTQKQRDAVIRDVRQRKVRVLVTTDVLARGIDFDACDFVVHMDVPLRAETYLHRVGRAGRFGREGISLLMYDEGEVAAVLALEEDLGYTIGSQGILNYEKPSEAPESKDAVDTVKPLLSEDTPLSIHDKQNNERGPQRDVNDIAGTKSQPLSKEPTVSAYTPVSDMAQPASENPHKSLDRREVQIWAHALKVTKEGNSQPPLPAISASSVKIGKSLEQGDREWNSTAVKSPGHEEVEIRSDALNVTKKGSSRPALPFMSSSIIKIEKSLAQVDREPNSTAADRAMPDMPSESFLPESKSTKEVQPSLSEKRSRCPEEPGTPAKKRKSARAVVVENLPVEDTGPFGGKIAETFAESPRPSERPAPTVRKRQSNSQERRASAARQNGDHRAPNEEEAILVTHKDAGSTQQSDDPEEVNDEQRKLEKIGGTLSQLRSVELARPPSRDPGMGERQRIVAKQMNHPSGNDKGAASAVRGGQAEEAPSDDISCQQHLKDNDHLNNEHTADGPETEPYSEQCREAWDRYAEAAYDTGYREAYEEAFRMARELRQRLERTV